MSAIIEEDIIVPSEQAARSLAHDLNQPLTAISAYAQACRRKINNDLSSSKSVVASLDKIISQTVRASKLSHSIRKLYPRHGNVVHVLNQILHTMEPYYQSLGVSVQMNKVNDLPSVQMNPDDLGQVLGTAILFAIHQTGDLVTLTVMPSNTGDAIDVIVEVAPTGEDTGMEFCFFDEGSTASSEMNFEHQVLALQQQLASNGTMGLRFSISKDVGGMNNNDG